MNEFDMIWDEYTETYSHYYETTLEKTKKFLEKEYGVEQLYLPNSNTKVGFETYVQETYPSRVLDVIEAFYYIMKSESIYSPETRERFTKTINKIFKEERAPWFLNQGKFYKIDYDFFTYEVVNKSHNFLREVGFQGAYDEFTEARNDFEAQEYKNAILNSCKSMESVLKTILCTNKGNASDLLNKLKSSELINDLPEEVKGGFISQVLMAVPFLRNKLSGHGQGEEKVCIAEEYAELSLNIAGSIILFLVKKFLKNNKTFEEEQIVNNENARNEDFDLPF